MYLAGVSVRRVEDITEALWGTRVSPGTVSNLNKKIYAQIEAWRMRPIEGKHPYLYLDGIVLKRSWAGEVRNVSLLVAIGVNADGYREILGIVEGAKEDKAGWSGAQRCASHPQAPQGARPAGHRAGDLRCLPGPGRERRRGLSPGPLAALRRALVAQCLQPCAERQDARGLAHAQGDPRPGEPRGGPSQGGELSRARESQSAHGNGQKARQPRFDRRRAEGDPERNHKHGDREGAAGALNGPVHGEDRALLDELVRFLIFANHLKG